jgi:putative oxygen-independent coproporphyrinogen III oxidase
VECNPDTVDGAMLDTYRSGGVNRLSFGVQSMVPEVLAALGRTHDPVNVQRSVVAARAAGFESFNLDLIYGGAGETVEQWRRTLDAVVELDPPHVSAYALTVEAGTPLAADPARHPDDDDQADKYLLATEVLGAAGLEWYEISNWARPGHECRHNELYWAQGDYLGFGCAAHSHRAGRRWWNVRTPERYVDAVAHGRPTETAHEDLDADRRRIEGLQLSLRTTSGVPEEALSVDDRQVLDGLVETEDGRLRLTVEGRLLANEVAVRLR